MSRDTLTLKRPPEAPAKIRPSMWVDWLGHDVIVTPIRGDDIVGTLVEVSVYELMIKTDAGPVLVSKGNIVQGCLA